MILSKEIQMNITHRNKNYYRQKGYVCDNEDSIMVKVVDLPNGSNYYIEVLCDFCKKGTVQKEYYRYWKERKYVDMDCCKNIECITKKNRLATRKPLEQVIKEVELTGYKFISTIGEYENSKSNLILECENGHQLPYSINGFQQLRRCSKCTGKYQNDHTYEEVLECFTENNCILLETEYISMKTPLNFICSCGYKSRVSYYDFRKGTRCVNCGGNKKYKYEDVKNIFKENGCELLSLEYKSNGSLLDYICSCGNISTINLSNFKNGVRCNKCYRESNKGENHPAWNPDLTHEERLIKRNYEEYKIWRNTIFERDKYICQVCFDAKGHNLNAHHIEGYNWCIERRLDIDNGITLCKSCHNDFHNEYGLGNNTYEQFTEWLNNN